MLKIALLLFKIYVLVRKKGISGLVFQVAAKSTAGTRYKSYVFQLDEKVKKFRLRLF